MSGIHMRSPTIQFSSINKQVLFPVLMCTDFKSSGKLAFNENPTAHLMLDIISRNYANGIMFLTTAVQRVKLHAPHDLA